ncbi:hypothetical protein GUJ93_ZPchr0009g275 [Zizania palustris]|uniref:Uncharacterized protein n=1 Tax=Zizania palustris TaxID=103762 RepID=A0A8J5RM03_ZIZPA|nr:hypothetical protein GUJ93_ZPchr0009g275 [Zizania palustris]
MMTTASSSCSTGKETLAMPRSDLGHSTLTDRRRALGAMEGMWRKAKKALGAGLCVHLPAVSGDREDDGSERPMAEAGRLERSKSGTKSSKLKSSYVVREET